jgi:putative oxidoreductase
MSDVTLAADKWQNPALSLLRFVAGLCFLEHGMTKLFGFPPSAAFAHGLPPMLWVAGIIELFGGALICIGLFTRPAALIASGEMAVGYFTVHLPKSPFPEINGGDAAILYCFIFFFLIFAGAGPISLDRLIGSRR